MRWRASHEGPERFLARSEHADWRLAQRWLCSIMVLADAPAEAVAELARAPPECEFVAAFGKHWGALYHAA